MTKNVFILLVALITSCKENSVSETKMVDVYTKIHLNKLYFNKILSKYEGYKIRFLVNEFEGENYYLDITDCEKPKCESLNLNIMQKPSVYFENNSVDIIKLGENSFVKSNNQYSKYFIARKKNRKIEFRLIVLGLNERKDYNVVQYSSSIFELEKIDKSIIFCVFFVEKNRRINLITKTEKVNCD